MERGRELVAVAVVAGLIGGGTVYAGLAATGQLGDPGASERYRALRGQTIDEAARLIERTGEAYTGVPVNITSGDELLSVLDETQRDLGTAEKLLVHAGDGEIRQAADAVATARNASSRVSYLLRWSFSDVQDISGPLDELGSDLIKQARELRDHPSLASSRFDLEANASGLIGRLEQRARLGVLLTGAELNRSGEVPTVAVEFGARFPDPAIGSQWDVAVCWPGNGSGRTCASPPGTGDALGGDARWTRRDDQTLVLSLDGEDTGNASEFTVIVRDLVFRDDQREQRCQIVVDQPDQCVEV